ncbi:MAG TPA: TonB-dependent receptor [Gemmatimonadaceae bacterium]
MRLTFSATIVAAVSISVSASAQKPDSVARAKRDSAARSTLPAVVVTATRTPRLEFNAPSPVNYVGSETISERMPGSIADLFKDLPGLDVNGVGTNQTRPTIRGQRGQRILLLEDGIRMNNSRRQQDFGELPSFVGLNDVARVEVVRGAGSVLYGTDAIAGVVNIITRDVPVFGDRSVHGALSYTYGSADAQRTPAATIEQRVGPFAYRLSGTTRQSNPYSAPAGSYGDVMLSAKQRVNDTGVDDGAYSALVAYDVTGTKQVSAKYERYQARNAGFGYVDPTVFGPTEPLVRIQYPDQNVDKVSLRYEARGLDAPLADRVSVVGYHVANRRHLSMDIFIPFGPNTPPGAGVRVGSRNYTALTTLGLRVEATKSAGRHVVTYGVDVFGDRSDNSDSSATTVIGFGPPRPDVSTASQVPNASFNSAGIFIQDEVRVLERLSLVVGARAQDVDAQRREAMSTGVVSKNRTAVATGNALYRLTDDVNLVASVGRGFRAPNLVERFFDGPTPEGSGYQKASPDLRAETSLNLDGGARFRRGTTSLEAFVFRTTLHDGIRIAPTGDSVNRMPAYRNVNIDKLRFSGVEAVAQTLVGTSVLVRANYTQISSRDVLNPNNPVGSGYATKLVGEVAFRPEGRFSAGYIVRYNGRMADGQVTENPVGAVLPAFTVHTLRGGVRVIDKGGVRGTLRFAIENLGNALYAEAANVSFFRPQAGRNLLASWALEF